MNPTIKSLVMTGIAMILATTTASAAPAAIKVTIDQAPVTFTDAVPYIDGSSRTMIPVRAVAESMGAEVRWDESSKTVTIVRQEKAVELVIGNRGIKVNGVGSLMDTAASITGSRTYVPLRFVGEAFDMGVEWDAATRTVKIATVKSEKPVSGNDFDSLAKRPISANEAASIGNKYFTPQEVAEVKKSMFPINLEASTVRGVYKDTRHNMFIVELSCEGYGGQRYGQFEHYMKIFLKDGSTYVTGPTHLDQGAVKLFPVLSKFSNIATEQDFSAVGPSEWVATYHTDFTYDYQLKDVVKIAIWDENTSFFKSKGSVIVIPISEIPEA